MKKKWNQFLINLGVICAILGSLVASLLYIFYILCCLLLPFAIIYLIYYVVTGGLN